MCDPYYAKMRSALRRGYQMAPSTVWTKEMLETVREMRLAGHRDAEIAKVLGVQDRALERVSKRPGMPKGVRPGPVNLVSFSG